MVAKLIFLTFVLSGSLLHAQKVEPPKPALVTNQTVIVIEAVSQKNKGPLLVYLYKTKDDWLKTERASRKAVLKYRAQSQYRWTLQDLPPGDYAVQVIHDEDSNGALTMGLFGPSEGVGVSNYVPSFIPRFDKAKFKHTGQSTVVTVEMSY